MSHTMIQEVSLDTELKKNLEKVAQTIRGLAMDGVQKANSGHPGLPMGCAEIGAYVYGCFLHHYAKDSHWIARDEFILSAGHGSMFLYSCLHLAGFDVSMDDLKSFRQLHSKTPGHPEYGETDGVETTTGPLGQGIGHAVGKALGYKILEENFNDLEFTLFNNKIVVLAGDGCLMEGNSSETCSFAGHLGLDNLILIYDSNQVTLDGPLADSFSEDVRLRYEGYGWDVYEIDGHSLDEIHATLTHLRHHQTKPAIIIAHTIIGKGSPNKAGTHKVHGSPLGPEEVIASKKALGIPLEEFYVSENVRKFFSDKLEQDKKRYDAWKDMFDVWSRKCSDKHELFEKMMNHQIAPDFEKKLEALAIKSPCGGREASYAIIQLIAESIPSVIGGSADLSSSDKTMIKDQDIVRKGHFRGKNIKYGIREFGMGTIVCGLAQTGFFIPFCGTFLTFSDYMRNAIRLASLMHLQVVYQFTHDSIYLGEDGPTHQPIEHYAALRAIPGLHVIRPGDSNEVKGAWLAALKYQGPTVLILTRQGLPLHEETHVSYENGVGRGAYIVKKEKSKADYTLFVTGSELAKAFEVGRALGKLGKDVRIVSMPCWEIFEKQPEAYRESVVGGDLGKRVAIEAGCEMGWHKYVGRDGVCICMESFGASAPASALEKEFGFDVESILERIL